MAERRCFLSSTPKTTKKKQFLVILHERFYEKSVRSDTVTPREHPMMLGTCSGGVQITPQVTGFVMKARHSDDIV